jgi:hypothetical protein
VLGVGRAGVVRLLDEDGRLDPVVVIRRPVLEPPTVKLWPDAPGRVLDAGAVVKGMASTTPGLRSPWLPGCRPASPDPPGMKPSTATPVSVSEETAATAAAGAPDRIASEAVATRWWRARPVARRLISSSRSGVH